MLRKLALTFTWIVNSLFQADHCHRAEHQCRHEADRHQWNPTLPDPGSGEGHDSHWLDQLPSRLGIQLPLLHGESHLKGKRKTLNFFPLSQLHPSSLDFSKEGFGDRCHVHLRGHKITLWTPAETMEKIKSCCCCCCKDTEERDDEDCSDRHETSFIQVTRETFTFHLLWSISRTRESVCWMCQQRRRIPSLSRETQDGGWENGELLYCLVTALMNWYVKLRQ